MRIFGEGILVLLISWWSTKSLISIIAQFISLGEFQEVILLTDVPLAKQKSTSLVSLERVSYSSVYPHNPSPRLLCHPHSSLFPLDTLSENHPKVRANAGKFEKRENGSSPHLKYGQIWEGRAILHLAAESQEVHVRGALSSSGCLSPSLLDLFLSSARTTCIPACSFSPTPFFKTNPILDMNMAGTLSQSQGHHFQPGPEVVIWLW